MSLSNFILTCILSISPPKKLCGYIFIIKLRVLKGNNYCEEHQIPLHLVKYFLPEEELGIYVLRWHFKWVGLCMCFIIQCVYRQQRGVKGLIRKNSCKLPFSFKGGFLFLSIRLEDTHLHTAKKFSVLFSNLSNKRRCSFSLYILLVMETQLR